MNTDTGNKGFLAAAERIGRFLENFILSIVLSGMILLAGTQILLRNFSSIGISWADEALRLMVLWIAMIGAVAASREYRHISIDLLSRFSPARAKLWTALIVDAFTATVCAVLFWYSMQFVTEAYEFQDQLLGGLPAWIFEAILPVAFFLMAYRYTIWSFIRIRSIVRGVEAS